MLDKKDRKLIYYLNIDARASDAQLARKIGLSQSSVSYRVDRLLKEGIIRRFAAVVNLGALDLTTFTLLMRFSDVNSKKQMTEFIEKHALSTSVYALSGKWDLFAEFIARDFTHLNNLVESLINKYKGSIAEYKLFISRDTLRVEHVPPAIYSGLNLLPYLPRKRSLETVEIDYVDRKILYFLSKNSVLSYVDLAKKAGVSFDVVRYRMKKLRQAGVLVKCFPELSLGKLGYSQYWYVLKLNNNDPEKIKSLRREVSQDPKVKYSFFDITGFNLIFIAVVENTQELESISFKFRSKYYGVVVDQQYYLISSHIKFNLFPKGLLVLS